MSDIIMLSKEERNRFALWCQQQVASNEEMAFQAERLGPHGKMVAAELIRDSAAYDRVATKLNSIEDMTIG